MGSESERRIRNVKLSNPPLFRTGILVFVLFMGMILQASAAQVRVPSEPLRLFVDFARFRGDTRSLYVELYYLFSQRSLTYQPDSTGFGAGVDLTLLVYHRDSLVYADRWVVPHRMTDSVGGDDGVNLVAVSALQLPDGDYTATIVGRDINNPVRKDTVSIRIPVRSIDTTRVVLSDLELASGIRPGSGKSPFIKNTLEVIPNGLGIFGENQVCYFYAEAYNLLVGNDRTSLHVRSVVRDAAGKELITREKQRKRMGESGVLVDQIAVNQLHTGTYTLDVSLLDTSQHMLSISSKKFFVYNQTLGVDTSLGTGIAHGFVDIYAGMGEADLDREFSWAQYERNEAEKRQYEQLSGLESKSTFLLDFWRRRPLGLREQYVQRATYANLNYRVLGREGYKTDRGRIHIVYGTPDDIERHPNEPETRPYEIWSYNAIQGGVIFVFVQRVSGGEYELVHSTHRNELHDELWNQHYAQTTH